MSKTDEVLAQCTNVLPGHGPRRSMKAIFQALADGVPEDAYADIYGHGEYIEGFEAEVAELFGKEAAVFMPSGIMAQQIALRIWCEQRGNFNVAMHPTAHLETHELLAYQHLHGIQSLLSGSGEFLASRMLTISDLEWMGKAPGAILLELPYRPLGGELPAWDDLAEMAAWARERGIPFHMDGARVWTCRPFYQKEFREIASLFDSLYVSFYKDLGGLSGSMLLGPASFIKEARVWQRRHGGNLFSMAPLHVSARVGMQRVLPQIDGWVKRAQELAAVFSRCDRVTIRPNPPQVNMFQLYIRGDREALIQKHLELAQETGTFLFSYLAPTMIPGTVMTEISCWENVMRFDLEQLPPFLERLLV